MIFTIVASKVSLSDNLLTLESCIPESIIFASLDVKEKDKVQKIST